MLEYFGFYDTTPRSEPEPPDEDAVRAERPSSRTRPTKPVDMATKPWDSSPALVLPRR